MNNFRGRVMAGVGSDIWFKREEFREFDFIRPECGRGCSGETCQVCQLRCGLSAAGFAENICNLLPGSSWHLPGTELIFREILVKFVKLDKVRLTEHGWSLFLTEMSADQNDRKVQDVVSCESSWFLMITSGNSWHDKQSKLQICNLMIYVTSCSVSWCLLI